MKIEHNGWIVEIPDNAEAGGYVYVSREDRPGAIHIKAEDEGWVADLWPQSYIEPHSTMMALYSDLDDFDEGDGVESSAGEPIVQGVWRLVDAAEACDTLSRRLANDRKTIKVHKGTAVGKSCPPEGVAQ